MIPVFKEAVQKATKPQAQSMYRGSGDQKPAQTAGGGDGARTSQLNPELMAQKDRLAAQVGRFIEPRQANLCLRAFRHDKFQLRMSSHSAGPGIWLSV